MIKFQYRNYRYLVKHQPIDERTEHFHLIAANKMMLISSNRPLFRKRGIKKRRPDYKVLDGQIWNISFQALIYEAIDNQVLKLESEGNI